MNLGLYLIKCPKMLGGFQMSNPGGLGETIFRPQVQENGIFTRAPHLQLPLLLEGAPANFPPPRNPSLFLPYSEPEPRPKLFLGAVSLLRPPDYPPKVAFIKKE